MSNLEQFLTKFMIWIEWKMEPFLNIQSMLMAKLLWFKMMNNNNIHTTYDLINSKQTAHFKEISKQLNYIGNYRGPKIDE